MDFGKMFKNVTSDMGEQFNCKKWQSYYYL